MRVSKALLSMTPLSNTTIQSVSVVDIRQDQEVRFANAEYQLCLLVVSACSHKEG
jgi:uncharacterized lipoprotein YajG